MRSSRAIVVSMGEFVASRDARALLETSTLGSCVAVALYDRVAGVGGLCHAVLDRWDRCPGLDAGQYADTAIPALLAAMLALGAQPARVVAHVAGGGNMFPSLPEPVFDIGAWNVAAARETLARLGIPVVAEDVGGSAPRQLTMRVGDGRVEVRYPAGRTGVRSW